VERASWLVDSRDALDSSFRKSPYRNPLRLEVPCGDEEIIEVAYEGDQAVLSAIEEIHALDRDPVDCRCGGGAEDPMRCLALLLLAVALTGPLLAVAVESTEVTLTLEPELWLLNGDQVKQPEVPLVQQMLFPSMSNSIPVAVMPEGAGAADLTALVIPEDALVASPVVNTTVSGATLLGINPTNRLDAFTKQLRIDLALGPGTVGMGGGLAGGFGGPIPGASIRSSSLTWWMRGGRSCRLASRTQASESKERSSSRRRIPSTSTFLSLERSLRRIGQREG
jgi:hypothetical protein